MGVNCDIRLPANVKVQEVAEVIGIVAGLKPEMRDLSGAQGGRYCFVPGVRVKGSGDSVPSLATISIGADKGTLIDGEMQHETFYHFEPTDCGRLLMPRSTAFWIAVGRQLVDFFGGEIDYNDCDNTDTDYRKPSRQDEENCPQDGKAWQDFQNRMFALKPITADELAECQKFAAYD